MPITLFAQQNLTTVKGKIVNSITGKPLQYISVAFDGSKYGTNSDADGNFTLSAEGMFSHVTFSHLGFKTIKKAIKPGEINELQISLASSQTQLKEVTVVSGKKEKYRNKGNPAVELIRQVIAHKDQNRMESADYLQYDQYERVGMSLFNLPKAFINSGFFSKYKFMLDSNTVIDGKKQVSVPALFSEKLSQHFYRKLPEKTIQIMQAEKGINVIKFIDTAGVNIYVNRLYGNNIDLYSNNIFILSNYFLSPIADHSPDFYKFFIADTIQTDKGKLVELSFTPRNKGDILFDGKIAITLDGNYAVQSCELNLNKQININFVRSLKIKLDFKQQPGGRYYLTKSDVTGNLGILRDKGFGVFGQRTVVFSNYVLNTPKPEKFYEGKSLQSEVGKNLADTGYFTSHRTDTLTAQQSDVYAKVNRLQNMRSYKRTSWIANTFVGGFAESGPVSIGPIGQFFSFDSQEGVRLQVGGRTNPKFDSVLYLEGYTGYGIRDKQFKYDISAYISLNKTPFYRYPNNFFKITYLYDVNLPGQSFAINNNQEALTSFHTGHTDYWLYNRIFSVAYVKDLENHFSYLVGFRNWDQQAAGTLSFIENDASNTFVHDLPTSELEVDLRYAPHEQILQGTQFRRTIHSKYPIFNLSVKHGFSGLLNGVYNYNNIYANIYKRVYMSQLGYADVTLLGSLVTGKVPFPLLSIAPANQSLNYDPDAYNKMYYLEFVSDHYVGFNFTQSFNGFFLNKIPLVEHLKWREFLSFKVLYGGIRDENNPLLSTGLYRFPPAANGAYGTYALGKTPYVEAGVGIGNIFKLLRVDLIKRFNYLDHPGVSMYGVKFSIQPDF